MSQVSISRRLFLAGPVITLGAVGLVTTSCAAGAATINPATADFLYNLGVSILGSTVYDTGKAGIQAGIEWTQKELHTLFRDAGPSCYSTDAYARNDSGVQFIAMQFGRALPEAPADGSNCPKFDPMSDRVIFGIKGKSSVLLDAWAWQTLIVFNDQYLGDSSGQDLQSRKDLLKVALAPVSPRKSSYESKLGLISSVSFKTLLGWVDIGRSETQDGYRGHIKISGIGDANGDAYIGEYDLPTKAAT